MIKTDQLTRAIFFVLLFSPLLGYIYTVWFSLPKTFLVFQAFFIFFYGILFLLKKRNVSFPLLAKFALIFALYKFAWAFFIDVDRHFFTSIYHFLRDFSIFFLVIVVYNTKFTTAFIRQSLIIIKATVILALLVSLIQVVTPEFFDARMYLRDDYQPLVDIYRQRRTSLFGFIDPNAYGLAFIPLLSVLIGHLLCVKSRQYVFFLVAGGGVAFLTNARYIMVSFIILTIIIVLSSRNRLAGLFRYTLIASVVGIVILQLLVYLGYDFGQWYESRLLAEGALEETTRFKAIGNFLVFFPQNPWFGAGLMTEEIRMASRAIGSSQIHVGYLAYLVYYGVVGCFFLFSFWFLLTKKLFKTAKKTNYWGSLFAFIVFFWSFATMVQSQILYYGLIYALIFDKYYSDKHKETHKVADVYGTTKFVRTIS